MKPILAILAVLASGGLAALLGYRLGHADGMAEARTRPALPDPFAEEPASRAEAADERIRKKVPREAEPPSRRGRRERPVDEGDRTAEPAPRIAASPVVEITTFDSDGAELGRHPAAVVLLESGSSGLLVTMDAISDAQSARVVTGDGITGRVEDVTLRSPGRGLAVVSTDLDLVGTAVADESIGFDSAWYLFPGDAAPRPARAEGEETIELRPGALLLGIRLDVRAPSRGAVLLDRHERIAGLVTTNPSTGTGHAMALPVLLDHLAVYERVGLSLAEYHRLYFSGSVEALLREARKRLAEREFDRAVSAFRTVVQREPQLFEEIAAEFRSSYAGRLRELPAETRAAARFEWLAVAVTDFPDDAAFQVDLADTAARLERWEAALSSYEIAWRSDPNAITDLDAVLSRTYLAWGELSEKRGLRDDAVRVYDRGVRHVPGSAELWRAYGLLLIRMRDYVGAGNALREAVAIDPRLGPELEPIIVRADRFSEGPGKVVIDYPPGSRSILARVTINGGGVGEFIIDTGATSSFVPEGVAAAAGLDTSYRVPRRTVRTAGGDRVLPYSPVDEMRIGDLAIGGISVIVGDLPGMGNRGLLGMDFLGSFAFENDSSNGRFVIYEKR